MPVGTILVYVTSDADNALGENILKLPLLLALSAEFPSARIAWVPGTSGAFYLQTELAPLVDGRIAEFVTDLHIPVDPGSALRATHPILNRHFDLIIDTQRYLGRTLFLKRIPHQRFYQRNLAVSFLQRTTAARLVATPAAPDGQAFGLGGGGGRA